MRVKLFQYIYQTALMLLSFPYRVQVILSVEKALSSDLLLCLVQILAHQLNALVFMEVESFCFRSRNDIRVRCLSIKYRATSQHTY